MEPTRRAVTTAALGVTLGGSAPITGSVVPLVGLAVLASWLLSAQLVAVRSFRETAEAATVTVEPERQYAQAATPVSVSVTVERPEGAATTALSITCPTPPGADPIPAADRRLELAAGETRATTSFQLRIPTAGRFQLPEPAWTLTDRFGLFTASYSAGPTPEFQLSESARPRLHVGKGGTPTSLFGETLSRQSGSGIIPDRIRPYVPSDAANRIDWNATARLREPHVREFDAATDQEFRLIVDHRTSLAVGGPHQPMGRYLRDVALGIVTTAEQRGDRIGLVTVGNEGLTTLLSPTRRPSGYEAIRQRLLVLEPTPSKGPTSTVELDHPTAARRLRRELADREDAFSRTLHAFATTATAYVELSDVAPLSRAVRYQDVATTATQLTAILTDDTNRTELWEAVQRARRQHGHVFVFLTPRCLFAAEEFDSPGERYAPYRAFEQFRTQLDRLDSVTAVEVAPADRLDAVLPARPESTTPSLSADTSAQPVSHSFSIGGRTHE